MGRKLNISPGAFIFLALLITILPFRWWLGAVLAAFVHEMAHLAMIFLTDGLVNGIEIMPMGATIEMLPVNRGREALCAAAGPAGSFLFASLTVGFWPEAAVCAALQGSFNLFPIYPLDGGRLIRCLFPKAIYTGIEIGFLVFLLGAGVWSTVNLNMGIYPILPGYMALIRRFPGKIPCKEPKLAVQ